MEDFVNDPFGHLETWLGAAAAWVNEHPDFVVFAVIALLILRSLVRAARRRLTSGKKPGIPDSRGGEEASGMAPMKPMAPVPPRASPGGKAPLVQHWTKDDGSIAFSASVSVGRPAKREKPAAKVSHSPARQWAAANRKYKKLCQEYTAFECDPFELVRLPVLADVTFDTTATFIEAFHLAGQLATESQPPDEYIAPFAGAVDKAVAAWNGARDYAEHVHASKFDPEQQTLLRRIQSALNLAEAASGDEERQAAFSRAGLLMRELEKVCAKAGRGWRVPKPALPQIETWVGRGQITAASRQDAAEGAARTEAR